MMRSLFSVFLLSAVLAAPTYAAERTMVAVNGVPASFWAPSELGYIPDQKPPVLIFSHGYGGCSQQSVFLMNALADHGYAVFAPNHGDARCENATAKYPTENAGDLDIPQAWNDTVYKNRGKDIADLIQGIESDSLYGEKYDVSRIGLIGHSLGGYTMLASAGGWKSWKIADPAIKAVLALSPYAQPLMLNGSLGDIKLPVMYQGGDQDSDITPNIDMKGGAYDKTSQPKYFVEFKEANHFSWTEINESAHTLITDYAISFLDQYVRGDDASASGLLNVEKNGVAVLRYQTAEGTKDDEPRAQLAAPPQTPTSHMASPNGNQRKGTLRDRYSAQPTNSLGGPFLSGGRF